VTTKSHCDVGESDFSGTGRCFLKEWVSS